MSEEYLIEHGIAANGEGSCTLIGSVYRDEDLEPHQYAVEMQDGYLGEFLNEKNARMCDKLMHINPAVSEVEWEDKEYFLVRISPKADPLQVFLDVDTTLRVVAKMEEDRRMCDICNTWPAALKDYRFIESCGLQGSCKSCWWCHNLNDLAIKDIVREGRDPEQYFNGGSYFTGE